MSKAKTAFDNTIHRSDGLIYFYDGLVDIINSNPNLDTPESLTDLVRSALVIGVSAFDSYFTDRYIEVLVPYLKKRGPNKKLTKVLEKAGFDTEAALEMIPMNRPYRRIRTVVSQYMEKYVTQRFHTIDTLFESMGLKKLSKNAEKKARRKNLIKRINIAINRRHHIVHNGDLTKHGKIRNIDSRDIKKRLEEIKLFVGKCHEIITSALE